MDLHVTHGNYQTWVSVLNKHNTITTGICIISCGRDKQKLNTGHYFHHVFIYYDCLGAHGFSGMETDNAQQPKASVKLLVPVLVHVAVLIIHDAVI